MATFWVVGEPGPDHGLAHLSAKVAPDVVFMGAGPDGRDVAGALSARTGFGVLTGATGLATADDGAIHVQMSVFGGRLQTTSGFTDGRGIVTVRPNVATAAKATS